MLFVAIVPILLTKGLEIDPARGVALVRAAVDCVVTVIAVRALHRGVRRHGRAILIAGVAAALAYWAVWTFSVVKLDFTFYDAFTGAAFFAWVFAILHRLMLLAASVPAREENLVGDIEPGPAGDLAAAEAAKRAEADARHDFAAGALRRCLLALYVVVGLTLLDRIWMVEVLHLTDPGHWPVAAVAIRRALVFALVGYVGYEALHTWSLVKFGPERTVNVPGTDDEVDSELVTGSRLATLLPILSRILLFFSIGISLLVGMSEYGINIGPILAGAGIFGLAISFGSQALVRDIVSGIFYIFDDAFRVGEYIDTGKQKGTVEKISLRSLRLRHQNGQVHTVPYGQLGTVTNFSRDWSTIKFNFRLARDSDLEKVRKTAKKCGLALLEHEEVGREFLAPLKMQGVADVLDNALLVRFKFTCLPLRSSFCQREAVKALYNAFIAGGVRFAVNEVVVQGEPGTAAENGAAAAQLVASQRAAVAALPAG